VCGPDESFEWSNLDAFTCGGSTPTADGIDQIVGLLEDVTAREKVAIVITDGKPNKEYGGGVWGESLTGDATDDAARVVRKARQDGMKVVGLGVGGVNEAQMGRIFGETGYVMGSMDNLDRKLVEVYRQQLRVD
jgi:Mg-chelatase subunit ChlD